MKPQKQLTELDDWFRNGGTLTVAEAVLQFGVYALSQRCGELRNHYGKPVRSDWIKTPNGARIKRYRYVMISEPHADAGQPHA